MPAVGAADKIVAARVRCVAHAGVGGVAIDGTWSRSVPVDELILLDEFADVGFTSVEGGDEGFGHVHPAIVRPMLSLVRRVVTSRSSERKKSLHVISPFGRPIVIVLR